MNPQPKVIWFPGALITAGLHGIQIPDQAILAAARRAQLGDEYLRVHVGAVEYTVRFTMLANEDVLVQTVFQTVFDLKMHGIDFIDGEKEALRRGITK